MLPFVIMIILMLGPNSFCSNMLIWTILGSSVSIVITLEEFFLFGLLNGGHILT
jgi:hypothetical protein